MFAGLVNVTVLFSGDCSLGGAGFQGTFKVLALHERVESYD